VGIAPVTCVTHLRTTRIIFCGFSDQCEILGLKWAGWNSHLAERLGELLLRLADVDDAYAGWLIWRVILGGPLLIVHYFSLSEKSHFLHLSRSLLDFIRRYLVRSLLLRPGSPQILLNNKPAILALMIKSRTPHNHETPPTIQPLLIIPLLILIITTGDQITTARVGRPEPLVH
jgi:hypothetical protein